MNEQNPDQFPVGLKVTNVVKHCTHVWSFFMEGRDAMRPDFVAGQAALLEMHDFQAFIAFASSPQERQYEFLIKRSDNPGLANALFDPLDVRDLQLKEIVGIGFPLENYQGCDLVFVAMGTGLAPLRSALRQIFPVRRTYGRLVVLYGVRTTQDFCFQDEMKNEWRDHDIETRLVVSSPGDSDWAGPVGYVQSLLDNLTPDLHNPVALICGSREMMEQTRTRLLEMGFDPTRILTNY
jgi:NAD(P)H-flavin reductase